MRSENFAEFIRSYNFADDYNGADVVFEQIASGLGNGDYATTEDAARDYVQRCAEVAAQMAENS